jgi:hypothetical protein
VDGLDRFDPTAVSLYTLTFPFFFAGINVPGADFSQLEPQNNAFSLDFDRD